MKPETKFRNSAIQPLLKSLPSSFFDGIQQVAKVGSLDYYGCCASRFVGLEVKAYEPNPNHKKTGTESLQDYNLQCIVQAGGIGIKVYPENLEEVRDFLHNLSRGNYDPNSIQRRIGF